MPRADGDDAGGARRRRRRQFAREHHPDRGGDPEVFATGWRALTAVDRSNVVFYRRRGRRLRAVPRWFAGRVRQRGSRRHTRVR